MTSSSKVMGRVVDVAVHDDEVVVEEEEEVVALDVEVAVEDAVEVVVVVLPPQSDEEPSTTEAGRRTLGNPEAIGTGISPFESTVTDVQVYASMSSVPDV